MPRPAGGGLCRRGYAVFAPAVQRVRRDPRRAPFQPVPATTPSRPLHRADHGAPPARLPGLLADVGQALAGGGGTRGCGTQGGRPAGVPRPRRPGRPLRHRRLAPPAARARRGDRGAVIAAEAPCSRLEPLLHGPGRSGAACSRLAPLLREPGRLVRRVRGLRRSCTGRGGLAQCRSGTSRERRGVASLTRLLMRCISPQR